MQKGFTLAEVLITLVIIGVVAALTIPSVIQNQQKRSLEVATKKFYTNMSNAVRRYMADEGVDDLRNTPLASNNYEDDDDSLEAQKSIDDFVTKYFKVVKKCEPGHINECFYDGKYKTWGESHSDDMGITNAYTEVYNSYVIADGMSLAIGYYGYNAPIEIYVDVNGKKGPNKVGYDLWTMDIFYDGTVDEACTGAKEEHVLYGGVHRIREREFEMCQDGAYGGCFGHFLENNFKFDY